MQEYLFRRRRQNNNLFHKNEIYTLAAAFVFLLMVYETRHALRSNNSRFAYADRLSCEPVVCVFKRLRYFFSRRTATND